jgi:hypothetical protein
MSALGEKIRGGLTKAPPPTSALGKRRAAIARGEDVTLPLLGACYIELNPRHVTDEIEAEVYKRMSELELDPIPLHHNTLELQRAARTLARAVRTTEDHAVQFGSVDEWLDLDDDLVNACGYVYMDVRHRLDPIGGDSISDDDFKLIKHAFEKKDPRLLRGFGVSALVIFMLTSEFRLSSSPTPTSSTGPASSADS